LEWAQGSESAPTIAPTFIRHQCDHAGLRRGDVTECATGRVDLIVVLVFALVGTELFAFLEECVIPDSSQKFEIPSLCGGTKWLRAFEFTAANRIGVYGIPLQHSTLH